MLRVWFLYVVDATFGCLDKRFRCNTHKNQSTSDSAWGDVKPWMKDTDGTEGGCIWGRLLGKIWSMGGNSLN